MSDPDERREFAGLESRIVDTDEIGRLCEAALGAELARKPDVTVAILDGIRQDHGTAGCAVAAGRLASLAITGMQHSCHPQSRVLVSLDQARPDPQLEHYTALVSEILSGALNGNGVQLTVALNNLSDLDPIPALVLLVKWAAQRIELIAALQGDAFDRYDAWQRERAEAAAADDAALNHPDR